MKWVYVMILVALVALAATNESVRGIFTGGMSSHTEKNNAAIDASGGRAAEMDAASKVNREASR